MNRLILVLSMALALTACGGRSKPAPSPAPAVVNTFVIDRDGRCKVSVHVATYELDRMAPATEAPLREAMRAMDAGPLSTDRSPESAARRSGLAHAVRKAFVRWMKQIYEVSMSATHGPFRCHAKGFPAGELSSDALVEKHALFAAFVDRLRNIPEPRP